MFILWRSSQTFENWLKTHSFISIEALKNQVREFIYNQPDFEGDSELIMGFIRHGNMVFCRINFNIQTFQATMKQATFYKAHCPVDP